MTQYLSTPKKDPRRLCRSPLLLTLHPIYLYNTIGSDHAVQIVIGYSRILLILIAQNDSCETLFSHPLAHVSLVVAMQLMLRKYWSHFEKLNVEWATEHVGSSCRAVPISVPFQHG